VGAKVTAEGLYESKHPDQRGKRERGGTVPGTSRKGLFHRDRAARNYFVKSGSQPKKRKSRSPGEQAGAAHVRARKGGGNEMGWGALSRLRGDGGG